MRARDVERNVGSGVAGADKEHIARPELARVLVLARVQLHDARIECPRELRHARRLIGRHRDHNVIGLEAHIAGVDDERGIVPGEPGFYFVGLHFVYSFSSTMIHGVERDAVRIADTIQARVRAAAMQADAAVVPLERAG